MTLSLDHPDLPFRPEAPPRETRCARAAVQRVRWGTGLSQAHFAATFGIDREALEAMEAGRAVPDAALLSYLAVIEWSPNAVLEALDRAGRPGD